VGLTVFKDFRSLPLSFFFLQKTAEFFMWLELVTRINNMTGQLEGNIGEYAGGGNVTARQVIYPRDVFSGRSIVPSKAGVPLRS
jgi:hypothetical protein